MNFSPTKYNIVLAVIFIGSTLLRLGLAVYNREANDPHMPVIRRIMFNNELPDKEDCWECFQPKMFHVTAAKILNIIGLDRRKDSDTQKIALQFVNFFAGIATLVVMWVFIWGVQNISGTIKVLTFALLAFNPQLIAINSQVTNDTFLILFCTVAIYCTYLFLKKDDIKIFILIVLCSVLAVSTKTNGWVTVIAIAITLCINFLMRNPRRIVLFIYAVLYFLSVSLFSVINPLNQFMHNYHKYGTPFVLNIEKLPRLPFSKETYTPHFGIASIQEGFFTFKLIKLIEKPVADLTKPVDEQTHYNSVWTWLYASSQSSHFEDWPPSWRSRSETVFIINRGIYILALVPVTLILFGIFMELFTTLKALLTQKMAELEDVSFGLFSLLVMGHLLFVLLYAFEYQISTVFKSIFTYPALLAFSVIFMKAVKSISLFPEKGKLIMPWLTGSMVVLLVFYVLDIGSLIVQLLPNQSGLNILLDSLFHIWL